MIKDFEYLWTTKKDEYCLVQIDTRYTIINLNDYFLTIIENNELGIKVIENMIKNGVRVFTSEEFKEYRAQNPVSFPSPDPFFGVPPKKLLDNLKPYK